MTTDATKICAACGRSFSWRRKWAKNWDQVRYCSERCRRHGLTQLDLALEKAILELTQLRPSGSICPSEAAKRVAAAKPRAASTATVPDWRKLMEPTRAAARRLARQEHVEITQRGRVVDPDSIKGVVRIRKGRGTAR